MQTTYFNTKQVWQEAEHEDAELTKKAVAHKRSSSSSSSSGSGGGARGLLRKLHITGGRDRAIAAAASAAPVLSADEVHALTTATTGTTTDNTVTNENNNSNSVAAGCTTGKSPGDDVSTEVAQGAVGNARWKRVWRIESGAQVQVHSTHLCLY
jgi:hypothetical protein